MQNNLDQKMYLKAFNMIIEHGEKHGGYYVFNDIKAWHDFDGYCCYLSYNNVEMTLMFHGKYVLDYKKSEFLDSFINKIKLITKGH